jgi:metal transporter CNNM
MSTYIILAITFFLVSLSAISSGLNIALMSLGLDDLQRKAILGNTKAQKLLPLRKNSNLSLASIIITNVAVISATSLVLDKIFNGFVAGIIATLLIVLFGEVVPQSLFSRHALTLCSFFSPILKVMIIITYPVSKPLQLLLDKMFGHESHKLQSRRELGIILGEHTQTTGSELDEDEIEIMRGALSLSDKHVKDIMTPIHHVYWLPVSTTINGVIIDEITSKSWSRIPVFDDALTKAYGVILMKDLVDINFDDEPRELEHMPLHPTSLVGSKTALDTLFRKFLAVGTHLLPVEKDDKIVGIVTIEDLIEEILGHEIIDETDRLKQRS